MFMLRWDTCIITTALLLAFGCGGENTTTGSSDPPPAISAPASLAGRTLDATVSSGSGAFATTGTFRVSFTASTYAIMGDGVNTANSNGIKRLRCITFSLSGIPDSTCGSVPSSPGTNNLRVPSVLPVRPQNRQGPGVPIAGTAITD